MKREPVVKEYDIVVVGGGLTGVAAAIAAARLNKRVIILEKSATFGGAATNSLVNPFMGSATEKDGKFLQLSRGIFSEIIDELNAKNAYKSNGGTGEFDEETLKNVLTDMVISSGADIVFHAEMATVQAENGTVESVTVYYKGNEYIFKAKYFIDATGDANLCCAAGFPFRLGRESDSLCQPMTLCFRVSNVNMDLMFGGQWGEISPLYKQFRKEGKIKNPREDVLAFTTPHYGVLNFNSTRVVKKNPTDLFDVTAAEIESRKQAQELFAFLKENFTAFKNAYISSTAQEIGIRESRMIDGEHILTTEELKGCEIFRDRIAVGNYDIDIHSPDGSGTSHYFFPKGKYYSVPYRCLIPKGSKNLLVAGRSISVTHEAQASIRIMPIVCTLGQAAGTAAALSADGETAVGNVDIKKLQQTLIDNGAFLG